MRAIASGEYGTPENPTNDSKGCGGVMRVSPVGLCFDRPDGKHGTIDDLWHVAERVAALTHGHELGWMSAGAMAHIVNRAACTNMPLADAIKEARVMLEERHGESRHAQDLMDLIDLAIALADNGKSDGEDICRLGEGWVAEETLAIAIYCSLRHQDDFSSALCASVNHDGDSDSTGALTGSILGARIGYDNIPEKWKKHLECIDVILEVADDLCHDYEGSALDERWKRKYVENRR